MTIMFGISLVIDVVMILANQQNQPEINNVGNAAIMYQEITAKEH